jgi:hypothetical protein
MEIPREFATGNVQARNRAKDLVKHLSHVGRWVNVLCVFVSLFCDILYGLFQQLFVLSGTLFKEYI